LVGALVEDGLELTTQLVRSDILISAAWWVKPIYDPELGYQEWQFFLASPLVDELGAGEVYKRAYDALQSMQNFDALLARISLGMIKMVGLRNPITEDVFKVINRFGGGPPIPVGRCRLGTIEAEEVNIFYAKLPAPWQELVIKTPVEVYDPSSRQERAAMIPIGGSGISRVQAGWPRSSVPTGTVVYAKVLGTKADPDPDLFFKLPDGRWGITHKSNTEPMQGDSMPRQEPSLN
jgi:hypothetical protein